MRAGLITWKNYYQPTFEKHWVKLMEMQDKARKKRL